MPEVDENSEVLYIIDGSGPDGKFKEGDDLEEEVIETLSTFLHCLTKDGRDGNKFQVSPTLQKRSSRLPNGDPAPLDATLAGSSNPYAPTAENPYLGRYSDSGKVFSPTIGDFLTKGKADTFIQDLPEGHTNKAGQTGKSQAEGPVFDAIRGALDGNRFSPGANGAFLSPDNIQTIDPTLGGIDRNSREPEVVGRSQPLFGRHVGFADPIAAGAFNSQDIRMEDLKKIGTSLMLRAAREIKAVQTGDPFEIPESFEVGLGALIPGASQIALLKVDTNEVRASAVMEDNFGVNKSRTDSEGIINPGNRSWGQLNTSLEPYDGFLPIGMTAIALVLAIAIRVLSLAFIGFLSLIVKEKLSLVPNRGPFIGGEAGKPDPPGALFSLSAIGIRDTERDFLTVVNEGLDIFFEFDGADFKRVVREPQFFTIFIRNVIRSGNIIVNEVADVFSRGQNPLAAAQAFIGLIDVLKSSKIIAFLNVLAQMGDKAAEIRELGFDPQERKKSSLENLPINPATNVMRIRNRRSGLASGMRTSATLSKFLFPKEILRAGNLLANDSLVDFNKAMAALPENHIASSDDIDGNGRLKSEVVSAIENSLDSEYVPFYFHDLRTNEIVSFHAFLNSLEDQYTPQYESSTAYGRIDNVRTYVATERTIQLTFNIVATSKDDFDAMWWKINKLSSLVYPSWTEGRAVSSGDTNFIQPFSQLPASTPVIRMRIGDLIRSNYSKFGLQRLFGIGTDKSNILKTDPEADVVLEGQKAAVLKERERMLRNPAVTGNNQDGYQAGETAILLPKRTGYPQAVDANPLKGAARAKALFAQEPNKRLVITASQRVTIFSANSAAFVPGSGVGTADIKDYGEHKVAYYKVQLLPENGATPDELSGDFFVTHDDLVPDSNAILASAGVIEASTITPGGLTTDQFVDEGFVNSITDDPFDPANNVIVRSFESTKGKGLGGVITGLNFSELSSPTNVWETSEFGSRAPKMVKCNITFAVIHDIAPGLDSSGFMRAVQYPVGRVAHTINGDTYTRNNMAKEEFDKNHLDASIGLRNPNPKDGSRKLPGAGDVGIG